MMWPSLIALAVELVLGAGVVCAEASVLDGDEQAAVGAVIGERMRQAGQSAVEAMLHPRAFARPHPRPRLVHALRYAQGRMGLGPRWSRGVVAFHARYLDDARYESWTARGWRIAHRGGHCYWRGRL
jgi:hypothetical protein